MGIGKPVKRQDALAKVMGTARYAEDMLPAGALTAKVLHSTIANGLVIAIDTSAARALQGVEYIATCFDVPDRRYTTPGHPYCLDASHRDIPDRQMLTRRVRYYGDDIAVVVASDALTAQKALELIKVTYTEYAPSMSIDAAIHAEPLHPECFESNVFAGLDYAVNNGKLEAIGVGGMEQYAQAAMETNGEASASKIFNAIYRVPQVHACHIENISCFAYMEGKRINIVTATQVPHIARRIVAEVLDYPMGDIRVIKPYVGGAFGNKQDLYCEPLAAYLTQKLGGRCVAFMMTREETFVNSRTRHGMEIQLKSVYGDGHFKLRQAEMDCEQGSYAAHGHAIAANAITNFEYLYASDWHVAASRSVYTNKPSGGAMRGYGIPQIDFAMEAHMDELALRLGEDPLELRIKHMTRSDFVDPFNGVKCMSNGLVECIEKGKDMADYERKRSIYSKTNTGSLRRGIGAAIYIYTTGIAPISLETASSRIVLNQNGSIQIQVGATEIGQGSDTALAQIASEVLKIPEDKIYVISDQDTDITPYDSGAYASRQTFVGGSAVKQTAEILRDKILVFASEKYGMEQAELELSEAGICVRKSGEVLCTIADVAVNSLYDMKNSRHITAESTYCMRDNAYSFGVCFADVEVDMPLGRVDVKRIVCVLDSGKIINPELARAQVHGGVAMGIGYALMEELLFDPISGQMRNNNLLDYKIPTAMDMPKIESAFIEASDPRGPFGNKSLGEPPAIPIAPAIRNAVLHATGVAINELPMTPQRLIKAFTEAGILAREDRCDV
ncbi:MAG: xanthine dehydrogenase molybdenum-binding subunit XdhA [Clostridia bacterium]